jgi:hypothetical protein
MILFFLILFGLFWLGMYPMATILGWVIGYACIAIKNLMRGLPLPSFFPAIPFNQLLLLWCGALLDGVIFWILYEYHLALVALKVSALFWAIIIIICGVIYGPPLLLRSLVRRSRRRHGPDNRLELSL